MTPIQYCYDKITSEKSSVYYVLKKIPSNKRNAVVAVAVFYQELENIILSSTDPMVAQQQLQWWRTEILKIPQGLATHPVCVVLQNNNVDPMALLQIIDGVEQTLAFQSFQTFEDLVVHIMRTAGARELLLMRIIGVSVPDEMVYQLSIVLELVNYIQNMHGFVRRNLLMFAEDELQQLNITVNNLHSYKTTPEVKSLLQMQSNKIDNALTKATQSLTSGVRESAKYLLARCDIAMATLREIQKSGYAVLEEFTDLTPLKKWWLAYRS